MSINKEEFKKLIDKNIINNPLLPVFLKLVKLKKCPLRSKKYPEGIMRDDNAGKIRELAWMIKSEVLVHIKTTHGITPEDLTSIFKKIKDGEK